jgi:hypothetical protein
MKYVIEIEAFDAPKVIGAKKHTYVGRVSKRAYWSREKQAMVQSPFVSVYNDDGTKFGDILLSFDLVFQPKVASTQAKVGAIEAVEI